MNRLRILSFAALALSAAMAGAQAGPPITVVVDGNPVVFPNQQPAESDGRVLVPLRGVFEKLGATVDWDPATQSILAKTRRTKVKLAIGQLDASVNDQPVHMDVPATLSGGTTMVPLRFVSEALGAYVNWNAPQHEVDIKSKTDYDIPRFPNRRPPVVIQQPPVVIQQPQYRPWFGILPADTVIPFVLNTRLNSANAQYGDQFTATLVTDGSRHYFDLPGGTIAYGKVVYVHRHRGNDPGVIELAFDHLVLPNGRNIPIIGRAFDMATPGVRRLPNGAIVAMSLPRHDHTMFTGYAVGPGLIVGVFGHAPIQDALIGGLLGHAYRPQRPHYESHDVELRPGTPFGVRLYQDMRIPH